jgi:hypothetical protein
MGKTQKHITSITDILKDLKWEENAPRLGREGNSWADKDHVKSKFLK